MEKLIIYYKQLRAHADYVIIRNNTLTEKNELLVEEEQTTKLSMTITGVSSGGVVTARICFEDIIYDRAGNKTPPFLKE